MNERIKKLRRALDLTQQEFADKIGMKRNTVANYETDRNEPSNSVISLICKTFNVNETWLRTGEGEIFVQRDRESELSSMVQNLLSGESSEFKLRLITVLAGLKEEQWLVLEEKMREIVGSRAAPAFAPAHTPTMEEEARAEAEEYYREILEEKRRAADGSASSGSSGSGEKRA